METPSLMSRWRVVRRRGARGGGDWATLECDPALYMAPPEAAAGAYAGVEKRA
jgi:hypothetical protein